MTGRALVVVFALGVGALTGVGLGSCSSTIPAPPTGIDEPPTMRIVSPRENPDGGAVCVEVQDGPDAFVPVTVDLAGTFYLRPPGAACANVYNCGYLRLYVNNQLNNTSATATINALLGNLGDKYGIFNLTVELVWDINDGGGPDMFDARVTYDAPPPDVSLPPVGAGNVADPAPTGYYQRTVTIQTAPSCKDGGGTGGAPPSDAGTGGAPPADAGTGGAPPSDAGTGGAPPSDAGAGGAPPSDAGTGGAPPADAGTGGAPPADAGTGGAPPSDGGSDAGEAGPADAGPGDAGDGG